jgi:hypothetical protein
MSLAPNSAGYYRLHLLADDEDYPDLDHTASFLYDFNLLYEFSRAIVDFKYQDYRFSQFSGFRNQKRIAEDDKLKLDQLVQGSPLELIAYITAISGAAGTLWALTQVVEKIYNWRLNRQVLKLNRDKLLNDLQAGKNANLIERDLNYERFQEVIRVREAEQNFRLVENRLEESSLRLREFSVSYVSEVSRGNDEQREEERTR